jgi:SAM-dependent methyltransferase
MPMSLIAAARFLGRTYRGYPLTHRLHVLVRFATCPFVRTLDDIPPGGRFLELGAGHGIYSYFAARDVSRRVFAVEPDLRKALNPRHAPGVQWIAAFDECVRGTFDTIAVYDATYRMPIDYRTELYRRVFDRLRPGGTFILKDMDPTHRWKMKWARFQEWLSDTFLKVSIGSGFIYQTPEEVEATLKGIGFERFEARAIDRGYPHPHMIYVARKPS